MRSNSILRQCWRQCVVLELPVTQRVMENQI
jgi:hypothetical protein